MSSPSASALLITLAAAFLTSGCASYHRFRPTAVEHAGLSARGDGSGDMTDAAVVAYADQTRDVLRKRFHVSRNVRQGAATSQILLAGAAGFAGAFQAGARTVAGLAASSVGVTQLGDVFDTGARAIAYQQAVAKISEAESAYFRARAGFSPVVSRRTLTVEGALLLEAVNGATDAVELFQAGMLPTLEQMQRMEAAELHQRAARRTGIASARPQASVARRPSRPSSRPQVVVEVPPVMPAVDPGLSEPGIVQPPPKKDPPPDLASMDDQQLRTTLAAQVAGLPKGEAGRILVKHSRPEGASDQTSKQRLKIFVTEQSGGPLRALAQDFP